MRDEGVFSRRDAGRGGFPWRDAGWRTLAGCGMGRFFMAGYGMRGYFLGGMRDRKFPRDIRDETNFWRDAGYTLTDGLWNSPFLHDGMRDETIFPAGWRDGGPDLPPPYNYHLIISRSFLKS